MDRDSNRKHVEVFSRKEWAALLERGNVGLPPRLSEVAYCVLCGFSDKQIARCLEIELPTVRTHMGRLFSKLGVQDRQEVALFFFRLHRTSFANGELSS